MGRHIICVATCAENNKLTAIIMVEGVVVQKVVQSAESIIYRPTDRSATTLPACIALPSMSRNKVTAALHLKPRSLAYFPEVALRMDLWKVGKVETST